MHIFSTLAAAADPPAGGAALGQVAGMSAVVSCFTVLLLWLGLGHRSGRVDALRRASAAAARRPACPAGPRCRSGLPAPRCWRRSSASTGTSRCTSTRAATPARSRTRRTTSSSSASTGSSPPAGSRSSCPSADRHRPPAERGADRARLGGPGRWPADGCLRLVRADRLPARRRLAPPVRPGRDAVGPDAPDDARRRRAHARRDPRAADRGAPGAATRACAARGGRGRTRVRPRRHAARRAPAPPARDRRLRRDARRPLDLPGRVRLRRAAVQPAVPPAADRLRGVARARARAHAARARRGARGGRVLPHAARRAHAARRPRARRDGPALPAYVVEALLVEAPRSRSARAASARSASARSRALRSRRSACSPSTAGATSGCRCRGRRESCPRRSRWRAGRGRGRRARRVPRRRPAARRRARRSPARVGRGRREPADGRRGGRVPAADHGADRRARADRAAHGPRRRPPQRTVAATHPLRAAERGDGRELADRHRLAGRRPARRRPPAPARRRRLRDDASRSRSPADGRR